jgi:hypothetical protein
MPAYAKDGKVLCFFQSAQKFNTRYATFGFTEEANLDEGAMWPTAFALKKLTAAEEARIGALVKTAVTGGTMAEEKDKRLVRSSKGVQRTKGGLVIPIPKTEDFDRLLRKAATTRKTVTRKKNS